MGNAVRFDWESIVLIGMMLWVGIMDNQSACKVARFKVEKHHGAQHVTVWKRHRARTLYIKTAGMVKNGKMKVSSQ